jgi:hypothetical protein
VHPDLLYRGGDRCEIRQPTNKRNRLLGRGREKRQLATYKSSSDAVIDGWPAQTHHMANREDKHQDRFAAWYPWHGALPRKQEQPQQQQQQQQQQEQEQPLPQSSSLPLRRHVLFEDDEDEAVPFLADASYKRGIKHFESSNFEGTCVRYMHRMYFSANVAAGTARCRRHSTMHIVHSWRTQYRADCRYTMVIYNLKRVSLCVCLCGCAMLCYGVLCYGMVCYGRVIIIAASIDVLQRTLNLGHPNMGTIHGRIGESFYRLALAQERPEVTHTAELRQAYEHLNLGACAQLCTALCIVMRMP